MIEDEIIQKEADLVAAMKSSDVESLSTLLHENLCFVIPTGDTITKKMDLNNYRSGKMKISTIEIQNSEIHKIDDKTVNVVATVRMTGLYENQPVDGGYKYLRVWRKIKNDWQVIAGSSTAID